MFDRIKTMHRLFPILLLSLLLVSAGCRSQSPSRQTDPLVGAVAPTAAELTKFTNQSRIVLPTSAQPVRYRSEDGIDSAVWLQFRLPATQLPKFMASVPISAAEVRDGDANAESVLSTFRVWMPGVPKKFRYVETTIAPGRAVNAVFDLDDPQTVTVYLMWFTT